MEESSSSEKAIMMVGIDESEESFYALEWALDHLFVGNINYHPFQILLVYAKPLPIASLGLTGPGAVDVLTFMENDLKKSALKVIGKAKDMCHSKSVHDVTVKVIEGDPRNVLCEAAEKNHVSLLVLGNHGYGAIKRAFLGSVSDYCAHHVKCSVMIIKKPKNKK